MIMKTAWRSSARTSESDIYSVVGDHPGLAKFICVGDVRHVRNSITVKNMRSQDIYDLDADLQTSVLHHRLILGTVGRPLWEYTSDSDLLIGFRDAIRGKTAS
jgi:hypothetical protein